MQWCFSVLSLQRGSPESHPSAWRVENDLITYSFDVKLQGCGICSLSRSNSKNSGKRTMNGNLSRSCRCLFCFFLFQGQPYRFIDLWQIDCWSGKRCTFAKMQTTTKTLAGSWRTKDSGEFRKVSLPLVLHFSSNNICYWTFSNTRQRHKICAQKRSWAQPS